ncbi:hypothetical protein ABGT15_03060 [Flavobacterium enshiense]
MYLKISHSDKVTKINKSTLFIRNVSTPEDSFWKKDISDFFFSLFLKNYEKPFNGASITINNKGIYLIDFKYINPIIFNAFSNEIDKFSCE